MNLQLNRCCICGSKTIACNNPEPIRDGTLDCCDRCNLLVREARCQMFRMGEKERKAYEGRLRKLSYEALKEELLDPSDALQC